MPRPCWQRLLLLAAAAAALSAPPASAQPKMLAFGKQDCLSPKFWVVDAYPLNTATHRISKLRTPITKKASNLGFTDEQLQAALSEQPEFDPKISRLDLGPPYWMAKGSKSQGPPKLYNMNTPGKFPDGVQLTNLAVNPAASPGAAGVTPAMAVTPVTVTINNLFSITYFGTYKQVDNHVTNETYILYQCGTPNPATNGVQIPAGAKVFEIPLRSLGVPDTTALGFMAAVKLQDRVSSAPSYAVDACAQYIVDTCQSNADLDYSTWMVNSAARGASDALLNTYPDGDPKTITLSVPVTIPILRPQWAKYLGAFFNRDGLASGDADTRTRFYAIRKLKARKVVASVGRSNNVAWILAMDTYPDWGYDQAGFQFVISRAQYKQTLSIDAGGTFVDPVYLISKYPTVAAKEKLAGADDPYYDVAINPMKDPETARKALLDVLGKADVIIDQTYFVNPTNAPNLDALLERFQLTRDQVKGLPAFDNAQVYTVGKLLNQDGTGSDWFEGAMYQTDRVLNDFLSAVTPAARDKKLPQRWLHRLDGVANYVKVSFKSCRYIKDCIDRRPASVCPNVYWSCNDGTLVYGYRSYHCPPSDCTSVACYCCSAPADITPECTDTCAKADKTKCPR